MLIANAPCSWGTLEFEGIEGKRIGYAQMLDELVETGYTGTELGDWGFMPTEPAELQHELQRRQLDLLGSWASVAFKHRKAHAEGEKRVLEIARLLAQAAQVNRSGHAPFVVLGDDNGSDPVRTQNAGRVTPEMMMNAQEWDTFVHGVERIARAVREQTGLRTVFHPHCAGFVETAREVELFLARTDPELVGIAFDTGHCAYAGGCNDPQTVLDGLERLGDRLWYVHFKDCQPDVASQARAQGWDYFQALKAGVFCELGRGCVDFPAVLRQLQQTRDYQGWIVVEQDVLPGMGEPRDSALRNRAYLNAIGLT